MTWRPEWEEQPRRRFGFGGPGAGQWGVAKTLVAISVVVTVIFMVQYSSQKSLPPSERSTIDTWLGLSLRNAMWVYPWFTYVFVHDAQSVTHIVFNGVLLWFLGIELEQRLGRGRFLTLFFGSALVGAAAHVVIQAAAGLGQWTLIGASGGIFGMLFFIARETPDRPFVFFILPIPAKILAGLFVILEVYPLLVDGLSGGGVAHLCHLGGAAFGLLWFRRQWNAFDGFSAASAQWHERKQTRERVRAADDDAEMDRLLAKIHASGMASLDDRERAFLRERSDRMRGGSR